MNAYQEKLDQLFDSLELASDSNIPFPQYFDSSKLPQLIAYTEMIEKWNKSHDLVSQKKSIDIFSHHILDSLAAYLVYISKNNIDHDCYIDIGTGAGLPGVVWHMCLDQKIPTILFEPRSKRVNFLKEVRRQLELKNMEIRESRFTYEDLQYRDPLCSMRALKPDTQMFEDLRIHTDAFKVISLTTENAEFEDLKEVDKENFKSLSYAYSLDDTVQRVLRIY